MFILIIFYFILMSLFILLIKGGNMNKIEEERILEDMEQMRKVSKNTNGEKQISKRRESEIYEF